MLITDKPPLERIWSCLLAIQCDAGAAQDTCSNLLFLIPDALGHLTPLTRQKLITDDPSRFEQKIQVIENYADSAAADLSEIHRYTRLIRGALNQLRKEAEND